MLRSPRRSGERSSTTFSRHLQQTMNKFDVPPPEQHELGRSSSQPTTPSSYRRSNRRCTDPRLEKTYHRQRTDPKERDDNGAVVSLWRYPVKSMMGEELNASDITDHGLLGDRSLALIDSETGKVVSAKNPRKWPTMFDFRAVFTTPPVLGNPLPPVRVTLPGGVGVTSDDARFAELLTGALGRPVTLASAAPSEPSLEEYWPDIADSTTGRP